MRCNLYIKSLQAATFNEWHLCGGIGIHILNLGFPDFLSNKDFNRTKNIQKKENLLIRLIDMKMVFFFFFHIL